MESLKPFIKGIRNPDIYKDWIDEGELKAQRLAWGGDFGRIHYVVLMPILEFYFLMMKLTIPSTRW